MNDSHLNSDAPPELPNGRNPLIERAAYAANQLGLTRAKVNWGYLAIIIVGLPGTAIIGFACYHQQWDVAIKVLAGLTAFALPIATSVIVGNVALKGRNGGRDGG